MLCRWNQISARKWTPLDVDCCHAHCCLLYDCLWPRTGCRSAFMRHWAIRFVYHRPVCRISLFQPVATLIMLGTYVIRNVAVIAESVDSQNQVIGERLMLLSAMVFRTGHRYEEGQLSGSCYLRRMCRLRTSWRTQLEIRRDYPGDQLSTLSSASGQWRLLVWLIDTEIR